MEDRLREISPALRLKISKRAKRIALRLDSSERVVNLVVPQRMSLRTAYRFAYDHRDWIRCRLANLPERTAFVHGALVPFRGENRRIHVHYDSSLKTTSVREDGTEIRVRTNRQDPSARIERYFKQEAENIVKKLSFEKSKNIGRRPARISVRDTKSRWGSCSDSGNLSFSWRLVLAPPEALDYVVAHEVAHLVHMNHSKAFWALCRELSEDFEAGRTWIRTRSHELMRYGSAPARPAPPEE
jgi:hypothetical protein